MMIYFTIQVTIEITHFKANPVSCLQKWTNNYQLCVAWVSLMKLYHTVGLGQTQLKLDDPVSDQPTYQVSHPLTEIFLYIKCILTRNVNFCLDWCTVAHSCSKQIGVFYSQPYYEGSCLRATKQDPRIVGEPHFPRHDGWEVGEDVVVAAGTQVSAIKTQPHFLMTTIRTQ